MSAQGDAACELLADKGGIQAAIRRGICAGQFAEFIFKILKTQIYAERALVFAQQLARGGQHGVSGRVDEFEAERLRHASYFTGFEQGD